MKKLCMVIVSILTMQSTTTAQNTNDPISSLNKIASQELSDAKTSDYFQLIYPANESSFRGAELYADRTSATTVRLHLKKYYDLPVKASELVEAVTLYETNTFLDPKIITLKSGIDSFVIIPGVDNPLYVVDLSTEVDLGLRYTNYLFTWGYCISNKDIANVKTVAANKQVKFILSFPVQINEATGVYKHTPLEYLPNFNWHENQPIVSKISARADSLVTTSFSWDVPFEASNDYNGNVLQMGLTARKMNEDPSYMSYTGSFIPHRSPYQPLAFSHGKTLPFGSDRCSIEAETGKMECKVSQPGKYLASVQIKSSNNIQSAKHTAVFLVDVQ